MGSLPVRYGDSDSVSPPCSGRIPAAATWSCEDGEAVWRGPGSQTHATLTGGQSLTRSPHGGGGAAVAQGAAPSLVLNVGSAAPA